MSKRFKREWSVRKQKERVYFSPATESVNEIQQEERKVKKQKRQQGDTVRKKQDSKKINIKDSKKRNIKDSKKRRRW